MPSAPSSFTYSQPASCAPRRLPRGVYAPLPVRRALPGFLPVHQRLIDARRRVHVLRPRPAYHRIPSFLRAARPARAPVTRRAHAAPASTTSRAAPACAPALRPHAPPGRAPAFQPRTPAPGLNASRAAPACAPALRPRTTAPRPQCLTPHAPAPASGPLSAGIAAFLASFRTLATLTALVLRHRAWGAAPNPGRGMIPLHPALSLSFPPSRSPPRLPPPSPRRPSAPSPAAGPYPAYPARALPAP